MANFKKKWTLTFHHVYRHQAHGARQQHVAGCMHRDGPAYTVANQDNGGRGLTVAGSDHIGYITEGGRGKRYQMVVMARLLV